MTTGRELRTVFFHSPSALNLLLRKELASLQARMRTTGQRFGCFRRTLVDGTQITVTATLNGPVPLFVVRANSPSMGASIGEAVVVRQLESGLLLIPTGAALSFPLQIEAGTELLDYFSGPGTLVPCTEVYQYLQGVAETAAQACVDELFLLDWKELPPATDNPDWLLDLQNLYPSHVYRSALTSELQYDMEFAQQTTIPSRYTGLLRQAAAAKLGAGRLITELGVLDQMGAGLIRDNDYHYWLVRVGETGASAVALANSQETEEIRLQLASSLSGDDAVRFQTWLLADLTVDTTQSPQTLLSAQDLGQTYGSRSPLAYGWAFSYIAPWKAVIVTTRVAPDSTLGATYSEATRSRLDITINAGQSLATITATINVELQDNPIQPKPGHEYIWGPAPDFSGMINLFPIPQGGTAKSITGSAPVLSYFKSDGEREDVIWSQAQSTSLPKASTSWAICMGDTIDREGNLDAYARGTFSGGGFSGGAVTVEMKSSISGEPYFKLQVFSSIGGEVLPYGCSFGNVRFGYIPGYIAELGCGFDTTAYSDDSYHGWVPLDGHLSGSLLQTNGSSSVVHTLCFPYDNAEAYYALEQATFVSTGSGLYTYGEGDYAFLGGLRYLEPVRGNVPGDGGQDFIPGSMGYDLNFPGGHTKDFACDAYYYDSGVEAPNQQVDHVTLMTAVQITYTYLGAGTHLIHAHLVNGEDIQDISIEDGAWSLYFWSSIEDTPDMRPLLTAQKSVGGALLYNDSQQTGNATGGYTGHHERKRFIGFA